MSALKLKVARAEQLTPHIRSLTLVSADGGTLPSYSAGAHIRVKLPDGDDRPYSLVNTSLAPGATDSPMEYRLGVRLEEDSRGGSRYMHELKEGEVVFTEPPKNEFPLSDADAPAVLIAGGIGVTPIISMAAELRAKGRPFRFHYSGRSRPLMAFRDDIEQVCGDVLAIHCDDDPACCIDLGAVVATAPHGSHLYVCGPRGMIEAVREIAHVSGIEKDRVHFELFEETAAREDDGSFEVEIKSTGQVFTIPPDKTIIQVLEAAGIDLVYDCQRGDCGICQTAVIDGVPDHRDVILTEEERAANDVMQICVSRAKTARLVLDI